MSGLTGGNTGGGMAPLTPEQDEIYGRVLHDAICGGLLPTHAHRLAREAATGAKPGSADSKETL